MTGRIITPLTLPGLGSKRPAASVTRLSLPSPLPDRETSSVYGLCRLDRRGRLSFHAIESVLGWTPGTALTLRVVRRLIVFIRRDDGGAAVNCVGHLYLPSTARHQLGLESGSQVLVVADPDRDRLVVHPIAVLDEIFLGLDADIVGGDPS